MLIKFFIYCVLIAMILFDFHFFAYEVAFGRRVGPQKFGKHKHKG